MTKPFESTFIFSQSWTYNEEISDWEAPVPRPALTDDDKVNIDTEKIIANVKRFGKIICKN